MAAAPRRFTEVDKAQALVRLAANGGNFARTERETSIKRATLRRWQRQADHGDGPSAELVTVAKGTFIERAANVRDKALALLELRIDEKAIKSSELITTVGVLFDKIRLVEDLPTSRTEHTAALPAPEQLRELIGGFVAAGIVAAERRHEEIVEAEIVDVEVLASASSTAEQA